MGHALLRRGVARVAAGVLALAVVGVGQVALPGAAQAATDPIGTLSVTVSGTAQVGQKLTATAKASGACADSTTFKYTWSGTSETNTKANYTVVAGDVGKTLTVTVSGSSKQCTGYSTGEASAGTVAGSSLTTKPVTLSGYPIVGQTMTATTGTWKPDGVVLAWKWTCDGDPVSETATYVVTAECLGEQLTATVSGTLAGYTGTAMSATTEGVVTAGSSPSPTPTTTAPTSRMAGADRYTTAVAISERAFKSTLPSTIYVASGQVFPDALSAAPVAALDHAPLLLVPASAVPQDVADEISRLKLKATKIVVVGGPGAVSDTVFAQLKNLITDTVRVGGADRYDTSRKVAEYGMNVAKVFPAGQTDTAFIATGTGFPDALSAGAVAGLKGIEAPVILEPGLAPAVSAPALDLMARLGTTKAVVVGGTGVVGQSLFASIPTTYAPVRVAGADRYLTSQAIVNTFRAPLTASGSLTTTGVFATGSDFPDALAGAAFAGATGATLWVIPPTCVPAGVLSAATTLKLTKYELLGGAGALADPVAQLKSCA